MVRPRRFVAESRVFPGRYKRFTVLVNLAFRQSFLAYGSGTGAYVAFIAFYTVCSALTWAVYLRPRSLPGV
jgi:nitrate/nitrite transporter NarK